MTGTDTGVGKTWVTAQLAAHWTAAGRRVAALKAAESGCELRDSGLHAADDDALFRAAGSWQPERCRYRFEPAVAPGVASDDLGTSIDFAVIDGQVDSLAALADVVLVEGAGGWLVPMGGDRTIEDLAVVLDLPVLVVGRAGLGTINHALLTVAAIRASERPVVAVALSVRPDDDLDLAERNAREIERLGRVPVIMVANNAAELAAALGSALGLGRDR